MQKMCSKCKEVKALSEFNTDCRDVSGIRSQCKHCQYVVQRKRHYGQHFKPEAKEIARVAFSKGQIEKPLFCEMCFEQKPLDRHHPNYKKPKKVRWLCRKCHAELHKSLKIA